MAIEKLLIHFNDKQDFESKYKEGAIKDTSIVFIKNSKEIHTHSQTYKTLPDGGTNGQVLCNTENGPEWADSYDDTKLVEEINKKCNIVVCDNQYEFDQILTKDNNTIYLIKGDQDQWFSKEDGDELYDFYGELRERVAHLERLNGISDYDDEAKSN